MGVIAFSLAATLLGPVCAAEPNKSPSGPRHVQVGDASWYGNFHQGRRTASGEPYDPRSLTAAHPSLPLDSTVRVTNLKNGLSVDVRVNDRGPFKGRRVIDLSQKAAETIGLKRRGISRVKIESLPPQPIKPQHALYYPFG
jgi:rare lipoprotein A